MNDKERETLSAMVDGEVSEFELHQVLKNTADDGELRETWGRYQSISAVIQRDRNIGFGNTLADSVRNAIEQEEAHPETGKNKGLVSHMLRPLSGVAVAASFAFAVILGVQFYNQPAAPTDQKPALASHSAKPLLGAEVVAHSDRPLQAQKNSRQLNPSSTLSLQAQVRIQRYLAQHAEHASLNSGRGMMPFARLASAGEYDRIQSK